MPHQRDKGQRGIFDQGDVRKALAGQIGHGQRQRPVGVSISQARQMRS